MWKFIFCHEQSDSDTGHTYDLESFSPLFDSIFSCRENLLLLKDNQVIASWQTKSNVQ